jgi:hypothetical protein
LIDTISIHYYLKYRHRTVESLLHQQGPVTDAGIALQPGDVSTVPALYRASGSMLPTRPF